jgi:hypothetical protein
MKWYLSHAGFETVSLLFVYVTLVQHRVVDLLLVDLKDVQALGGHISNP